MNYQDMLKKQVAVVVEYLEKNYRPIVDGGIIKLIYERYLNASELLEKDVIKITDLHLSGGVRAYMDSYSDYENPLLEEMDNAEKILKQMKAKG